MRKAIIKLKSMVAIFKSIAAIFTLSFFLLFAVSNFLTPAFAQSTIERSFVPKSKLDDKIWTKHDAGSKIVIDHAPWNDFLEKYIKTNAQGVNLVAYGRVSNDDKTALKNYLKALQSVDVTKLNRNEQFAYWVNLYNASTVAIALKHYPIESIRDIKKNVLDLQGPFNDDIATVNGKKLTLNTIESGIVRPIWNDPRLHYAFNCAAITCPNLSKKAFTGATLNAQLNAAASEYVNSSRGITFNEGKIIASKIYFWYENDFGGSEASILKHIDRYSNAGLKAKLKGKKKIDQYVYDWSLNDAQ